MVQGMSTRLDTRDVDSARLQVARSYCPHELLPRRAAGFHARHAEGGDGELAVFVLSYGAGPVRVEPVPFGDFVLVSRPLAGHLTVQGEVVGPGESVALDPRTEHRLEFGAGCRLLTIKLPCAVLDRVGAESGRPGAVHTGRPGDSRAWDAVTRFVLREVLPHDLLASPVGAGVVTLAATAVLDAFGAAPDEPASDRGRAAVVRSACRYIDEHAHEGIGLVDVASAAGVRPRTLQEHFHAELGRSPMAQLRSVRLHRARAELCSGSAATVAEAAYRWGFGNLGRFAAEYRRTFGRQPATDLRR